MRDQRDPELLGEELLALRRERPSQPFHQLADSLTLRSEMLRVMNAPMPMPVFASAVPNGNGAHAG